MGELPFRLDLVRALADGRSEPLTTAMQLFTLFGDVEGYVLLVTLIYVTWNKSLAYRLSVLVLVAMSLDHLLKMLIMNPRPFVAEGTYLERWAVSAVTAAELATEYSTPSGHAMAGAAFYLFLFASVRSRLVRSGCILLLLGTGLSRPYLGVHYLEDVLLGWALGALLALVAVRYGARVGVLWGRASHAQQVAAVAAASLALWLTTLGLGGPEGAGPPLAFLGYTGFLLGVVAGFPLEHELAAFDPRSAPGWKKALRTLLGVGLILGTLWALDGPFLALARDESLPGQALRYLRYALAGMAGILVAPVLFVRLGLAGTLAVEAAGPGPAAAG